MLETLTQGFRRARDGFQGITRLTEDNVAEALRDVRLSLLEADVDLEIVREFLEKVGERCADEHVRTRSRGGQRVSAGDHFTKACYDQLVELMGSAEPLEPQKRGVRSVMMVGLQGTGKTSTCAKLARWLAQQGERPLLVAADVYRPAAREQLRVLGEQIGVEVYSREDDDAPEICAAGLEHARAQGFNTVILDTAGRLQIDEPMMQELEQVVERTRPEFITLVCDAMMGRETVNVARGFAERLELSGLILTKLDADARGGAALAIRAATGVPIRFIATGEGTDRLESFRPEGLASRILGMGDVVGLVQDFEQVVDAEQAEADAERLLKGQFTLGDFLTQLGTLQKMGPLKDMMAKLPGISDVMPEGVDVDAGQLKQVEAMILSMTPQERARPEILDDSRLDRVAQGSGTKRADLHEMLKRFRTMRDLMGQIGKQGPGLLGRVPGLGRMLGGGPGLPGGLDPAQLDALGMGPAGNRRAARAEKADARRNKRRQMRRHKRRGKKKRK